MNIQASYLPLNIERNSKDPLYLEMHSTMQLLGLLMPFTEQLNWDINHGSTVIGTEKQLQALKRAAAKNDSVLLWYAKLKKNTIYKQLILHNLTSGYILPFSFDEPFSISANGKSITFVSAKKLLDECKWLDIHVNKYHKDTPIYTFWEQLKVVCQNSISLASPVNIQLIKEDKN
jgi:hypothetical protein